MRKRIRGFTLVETMIVAVGFTSVAIGFAHTYNKYQESRERDERNSTTAQQLAQFAESSYKYASQTRHLDSNKITADLLQERGLLTNAFPESTPYGQEIQGRVIDSGSTFNVLISTVGQPESAYVARTGVEGGADTIQEQVFESVRRQPLSIDGTYRYGKVEGSEFVSAGNLHREDVSAFGIAGKQPAIMLISPDSTEARVSEFRAINAIPDAGIPANGAEKSVVSVSVRNTVGEPVAGEIVSWSAGTGTLSASSSITDENGIASVELKSAVAGNLPVSATIENGERISTSVVFDNPVVGSFTATPSENVNADGRMCAHATAVVQYPNGLLARNEAVQWLTDLGSIHSQSARSDEEGKATACLKSTVEGTANFRVEVDRSNHRASDGVEFIGPRIEGYNITARPASNLRADGIDTSRITIKATFPDGTPATGVDIRWSTTLGTLSSYNTSTDSYGETTISITSRQEGNAKVTARVPSGHGAQTSVGFKAPVLYSLTADKTELKGGEKARVMADLRYMPENVKARNGRVVYWSTDKGALNATATYTNEKGIASNLAESTTGGSFKVYALYGGITKSVTIKTKSIDLGIFVDNGTTNSGFATYTNVSTDDPDFGTFGYDGNSAKVETYGYMRAGTHHIYNKEVTTNIEECITGRVKCETEVRKVFNDTVGRVDGGITTSNGAQCELKAFASFKIINIIGQPFINGKDGLMRRGLDTIGGRLECDKPSGLKRATFLGYEFDITGEGNVNYFKIKGANQLENWDGRDDYYKYHTKYPTYFYDKDRYGGLLFDKLDGLDDTWQTMRFYE